MSYYGRTSYTFTWEKGRQLATAKTGGYTLSFEYNDEGIRTSKTVNGVKHEYILQGSQIMAEIWGNTMLVYIYDEAGQPIGMMYRTTDYAEEVFDYYLFEKDVFGNVVAIYNQSGMLVASYVYDAWGNCTVLTNTNGIGQMNPFRYRGYYLDIETNLYYLQTRYYDSYVGRFINADGAINGNGDIIGFNMFAYCSNNPVNHMDPTGKMIILPPIYGVRLASVDMLSHFFFGGGRDISLGDDSYLADKFRNNPTMNKICEQCIEEYKMTGQTYFPKKGAEILGFDELDLWLAIRGFNYEITISSREYTEGYLFWKKTKTEYILTVTITDLYDFNIPNEKGDGIGSLLNNMGYWFQDSGWGSTYNVNLTYTKRYNSPTPPKFFPFSYPIL